ncbi:FkbM family methyltransferase [Pontibacter pamirensis]|uniref:FkbM family methyltransferase n=1 Tax=Pontibacter pamirensis TaxID=2562824 RepID=UPI001389FE50|nr:FkbM family methyltransferase [Pontibacter pamirensis]
MKQIVKSVFSKLGYNLQPKYPQMNGGEDVLEGELIRNRFEPYECTFMGHTLYVHDYASYNLGSSELFGENIYKFTATHDKPYIIDCGANLGMSVIYFKNLYPNSEIVAFEADPHIYSFLKKNIDSFELTKTSCINKAVWNTSGSQLSFLSEGGAGGRLETISGEHKFVEVETVRLKDYLNKKIDFLKIDIEGAEYKVIEDCADNLHFVENLFIEYHSFPSVKQNLHLILEIVTTAGFRYHIKEAFVSSEPFVERRINFGMDLQLNIFCYRD